MTILGWKHFLAVLLAGIALMLFSGPAASAQDGPGQGLRINTFIDHLSAADVDRGPGRLSVTGAGFSLTWSHFTFGYRRAMFTWEDKQGLPFGNGTQNPWEALQTLRLGANYHGRFNDKIGWFVGGGISSSFEKEFAPLAAQAMAGLHYSLTPKLRLSLGALATYHKVRSRFPPILGLSYNAAPGPGPKTGFSAAIGLPETYLAYDFNPTLGLKLNLAVNRGIHRLAEDSTVIREGYVRMDGLRAGLFLNVRPNDTLRFGVGVTHTFNREMALYGQDGAYVNGYDLDDALGGAMFLTLSF